MAVVSKDVKTNNDVMERQILSLPEMYEKLKTCCQQKGITIKEVMGHAGIPPEYTSLWKKGEGRPPYYYEVAKMADKLDKPFEIFVYSDRDPYVHIEKEKYQQLLDAVRSQLEAIEESTGDIKKSDLFDFKKYVG
jgi:transcriptional regulator with XRE-family HTH domain